MKLSLKSCVKKFVKSVVGRVQDCVEHEGDHFEHLKQITKF